ncbi:hypothetical protein GCM10009544_01890 [Streptomyces stramineus]|uniref:Uncharacterized protein n=1 Tax=Streptomyces stramineus TaxID=173861 RepID=A0ABP3J8X2_9ACTN
MPMSRPSRLSVRPRGPHRLAVGASGWKGIAKWSSGSARGVERCLLANGAAVAVRCWGTRPGGGPCDTEAVAYSGARAQGASGLSAQDTSTAEVTALAVSS